MSIIYTAILLVVVMGTHLPVHGESTDEETKTYPLADNPKAIARRDIFEATRIWNSYAGNERDQEILKKLETPTPASTWRNIETVYDHTAAPILTRPGFDLREMDSHANTGNTDGPKYFTQDYYRNKMEPLFESGAQSEGYFTAIPSVLYERTMINPKLVSRPGSESKSVPLRIVDVADGRTKLESSQALQPYVETVSHGLKTDDRLVTASHSIADKMNQEATRTPDESEGIRENRSSNEQNGMLRRFEGNREYSFGAGHQYEDGNYRDNADFRFWPDSPSISTTIGGNSNQDHVRQYLEDYAGKILGRATKPGQSFENSPRHRRSANVIEDSTPDWNINSPNYFNTQTINNQDLEVDKNSLVSSTNGFTMSQLPFEEQIRPPLLAGYDRFIGPFQNFDSLKNENIPFYTNIADKNVNPFLQNMYAQTFKNIPSNFGINNLRPNYINSGYPYNLLNKQILSPYIHNNQRALSLFDTGFSKFESIAPQWTEVMKNGNFFIPSTAQQPNNIASFQNFLGQSSDNAVGQNIDSSTPSILTNFATSVKNNFPNVDDNKLLNHIINNNLQQKIQQLSYLLGLYEMTKGLEKDSLNTFTNLSPLSDLSISQGKLGSNTLITPLSSQSTSSFSNALSPSLLSLNNGKDALLNWNQPKSIGDVQGGVSETKTTSGEPATNLLLRERINSQYPSSAFPSGITLFPSNQRFY